MKILFNIPIGILLVIIIADLFILKKKQKDNSKLNKILFYVTMTITIISLLLSAVIGISYPCPCGCGSEEFSTGIKGIIDLFIRTAADTFILNIFYYIVYILMIIVIAHTIKVLIGNNKSKK